MLYNKLKKEIGLAGWAISGGGSLANEFDTFFGALCMLCVLCVCCACDACYTCSACLLGVVSCLCLIPAHPLLGQSLTAALSAACCLADWARGSHGGMVPTCCTVARQLVAACWLILSSAARARCPARRGAAGMASRVTAWRSGCPVHIWVACAVLRWVRSVLAKGVAGP